MHCAICETYLISLYFIDLLSSEVWGYMYPQYMYILLYVTLIWCNGIPYIYCQLELWGVDVSSVYVHSAICETCVL